MSGGIEWSDPPSPATRPRSSGTWAPVAAALRAKPNEWAIVMTKENAHLAAQIANNINRGVVVSMPKGDFKAVARTVDGECRVYARYVGGGGS